MKLIDKVKIIDIDKIYPYMNNPKKHPEEQINKIASSIKNYGFTVPIVIDEEFEIIAGHGRYKAAKKLELDRVPCIIRDDLNEAQVKALRLADNKVAESEWDQELLAIEIEELKFEDYDLELTGFDDCEIDDLLEPELEQIVEDDFNVDKALEEEPISKKGDLWLLGEHRLFCGDSTSPEDIGILMDGATADMIFTDPPYNVNYEGQNGMKIENDNMDNEDFYYFLYDFYSTAFDVTKEGGAIYVCHADSEGVNFRKALRDSGWLLKQCIIWVKNQLVIGRQDYQWKHEPILYGWKPGAGHTWNGDRKQATVIQEAPGIEISEGDKGHQISFDTGLHTIVIEVPEYEIVSSGDDSDKTTWFFNKPLKNKNHPTMKPVGIPARAIRNSCLTGEKVLDPFAGSGSTLIAAEQTGRTAYLNELDPKYTDVIVKRYIEFTGDNSNVYLVREGDTVSYEKVI